MAKVLCLSERDVEVIGLGPAECIDLVRKSVQWQAQGLVEVPAKIGVHPPKGRHINAMPAFVSPTHAAGVKWVADFPQNHTLGLPTIHGIIALSDADTGAPLCVMGGSRVTAMRTAAMTAISLQVCASPELQFGTIVGTGIEAWSHCLTLPKALPMLKALRIVGRDLQAAVSFCQKLGSAAGVELIPSADRKEAVRQSQVVVTVTNAISQPLLAPDWISAGSTVVVLDNPGKETSLLHSLDRVVVDDRRPFATEEVRRRFPNGVPHIDAEVGEVLASRLPGRTNASERILVMNLGSAGSDVVVASEVCARARKMGIGITVEL